MSHTRLRPSFSFTDEKLAELRRVVPEAFADGQVNWESLREALGEYLEDDDAQAEHFGLNWPGKREARRMAGSPSKGALVPQPGKGMNEESTRNVFIEGENLEVLKLLQKAYAGKVKMIYIDPPYNTGNDFVYEDDFTEPLEEYLRRTGQVDDEGKALTTNTRADGRFHSKWLSMMYPRLRLARQLLRDDGVIFVSIDDNEVHHLRALMSEVFGDENSIDLFAWVKTETPANLSKKSKKVVEFILCYQKHRNDERFTGVRKGANSANTILNQSNKESTLVFPANVVSTGIENCTIPKGMYGTKSYAVELLKDAKVKNGVFITPVELRAKFRWTQEKLMKEIDLGTHISIPTMKFSPAYERAEYAPEVPPNLINGAVGVGTNENASTYLRDLFGDKYFDFPKPVSLVKYLLGFTPAQAGDVILDFFAGSGTTGEAVAELNLEDGIARRFVLVQLPELLSDDHPGIKKFKTISDISRERLKRAFKRQDNDAGFLSFGLGKSHFRAWSDVEGADLTALEKAFAEAESPLVKDWTWEGLRTEVMLLEGFPLDSRVEAVKELKRNRVERIHHEWHAHRLLVCLDKKVAPETIKDLQLEDGDIFICLDTAIDDQSKLRLSDKGMIKTI